MSIEEAIEYATKMHKGQQRKDGSAYIIHPLTVCIKLKEEGFGEEYQIAGLFHDLLEDTNATEEDILKYSNKQVLEAVKLLTKTKGYDPKEYINNILKNPIAKAVKNQDRIHNLKDAVNSNIDFIKRYLHDTKNNYFSLFSKELDNAYLDLLHKIEKIDTDKIIADKKSTDVYYTIDSSVNGGPVYKTDPLTEKSWVLKNGEWVPCDPFFWADLGDNATLLPENEISQYLN